MNDRIFLLSLLYLFLASTIIGLMPSEYFSGVTTPTSIDVSDSSQINSSYSAVTKSASFFGKFLTFLFIPITITGIPSLIALILQAINTFCIIFSSLYVYKLIRGIS